jgi:DNA-binding response OmpR family regulator
LQSAQFGVVLLDLGLPQRDGIEILQGLRKRGDARLFVPITLG